MLGAMGSGILRSSSRALFVAMLVACAGSQPKPGTPASSSADDGGTEDAAVAAAPEPPVEHPFAKTAAEATTLIQSALDTRMRQMWKCIDAKRARANDPHLYVVINIGIDQ